MKRPTPPPSRMIKEHTTKPMTPKPTLTEELMREEWVEAGGSMHGPNIETVTMPEAVYFKFRQALENNR